MAVVSYKVVVTREGGNWLADVPGVRGAHTFARSLLSLDRAVREVIELMDDSRDSASEITIDYAYEGFDGSVDAAVMAGRERRALTVRERDLQGRTRLLASELVAQGFSVRDAARMLEITSGRVSQLVNS